MIFAKLDVCFWRHPKFRRAGPAACGFWAAALAYLREEGSSDGLVEHDTCGLLLGLGRPDAKVLGDRLCEVGLFAPNERGYILLRYADKNETCEEIEARRALGKARQERARKRKKRASHAGLGSTHVSRVTTGATSRVTPERDTRVSHTNVTRESQSQSQSQSQREDLRSTAPPDTKTPPLARPRILEPPQHGPEVDAERARQLRAVAEFELLESQKAGQK